jgi:ribosome biogenesis GTPase / thiamine phosphate phosphatase
MTTIQELGWNEELAAKFEEHKIPDSFPARIISEHKDSYFIHDGNKEILAQLSGKLLYTLEEGARLKVGDWIFITYANDQLAIIHDLLPRKNKLSRKAAGKKTVEQVFAANIDLLFIVLGLDLDFNLRRLERYLTLAKHSDIRTIILCNKADLCPDLAAIQQKIDTIIGNAEVLTISALTGDGLDYLAELFSPHKTGILLGSSGVGKSTITNRLLGSEVQKTQTIREDDSKGRHTTSTRELFMLPAGGCLIDTPGMREIQLWNEKEELEDVFDDIHALTEHCRFTNCSHTSEPGCKILEAVSGGKLDQKRYENYLKMKKELEFLKAKQGTKKDKYKHKQKTKKLYAGYKKILQHKEKNK